MHYDEMERASTATSTQADDAGFQATEEFERFLRYAEQIRATSENPESLRTWLDLAEAWRITRALRDSKGNRSAAARMLGIGRRTLYAKMDKLSITPSWNF